MLKWTTQSDTGQLGVVLIHELKIGTRFNFSALDKFWKKRDSKVNVKKLYIWGHKTHFLTKHSDVVG